MADGSWRAIEQVREGDYVLSKSDGTGKVEAKEGIGWVPAGRLAVGSAISVRAGPEVAKPTLSVQTTAILPGRL